MLVIPAIVVFGLVIALLLLAIKQASNGLEDAVNALDADYEKHGVNWGAAVFALVVLVLLYGIIGLGPLAGLVEVAP